MDFRGITFTGEQPELEKIFFEVAQKNLKHKKEKIPKGRAESGEYCPKEKVGQCWAYLKENKEDTSNE